MRPRRPRALLLLLAPIAALLTGTVPSVVPGSAPAAEAVTVLANDPVLVAVGDIACDPNDLSFNGGSGTASRCRQATTAALASAAGPAVVATLGDSQYESATSAAYAASYDKSWGRLRAITRPAVGNHEYRTPGAADYFSYFGSNAGSASRGYYSYDIGQWHVVVLNSNCSIVSCAAGSAQERWLRADLAAHPRRCTLAYMHHPRFSSGSHGPATSMAPFWKALYDHRADVVLAGHDHGYERFAKIRPDGVRDTATGMRSWVVGTGGKNYRTFSVVDPNSLVRNSSTFGVLRLKLGVDGYTWKFLAQSGSTFTDSGTGSCRA